MKVDDQGDIIWANVYEPTERDNNDFGFSIVFEDDGDYGICLESSSFNAISGPQAPNKNVIYTTDSDGNLERVILFNPKGSQYTKMSKAADGGYFVTGFSTYYISSSTAPFNGLAFKTDADYTSGECEEYDRTNQVVTTQVPWVVQDISGEERTNIRVADYAVENDWAFDSAWIICSRIPEIFVEIMPFPDSVCTGETITLGGNPQGGITDYTWDLGSGDTLIGQQVDYAYDTAGAFQIILTATDGCQTVYDTQMIVVTRGETFDVSRQLCPGDTLFFMDSTITEGGQYTFQGGGMDKCDTTFNLTVTIAVQDTTTDEVTICPNETITYQDAMITDTGIYFIDIPTAVCDSVVILTVNPSEECPCEGEFPAAFSPNGDMVNDTYGMFEIEGGCSPLNLEDFSMVIFNRWGNKVFETNDVNMHWDGRCDGSDCISEVYLVTYSYRINGEVIQRNRDVTLVR
jgi:gliding motility-associated-like protein